METKTKDSKRAEQPVYDFEHPKYGHGKVVSRSGDFVTVACVTGEVKTFSRAVLDPYIAMSLRKKWAKEDGKKEEETED